MSCSAGRADENQGTTEDGPNVNEFPIDHHSYANVQDVRTTHLHLDINVDFERKVITGSVLHDVQNNTGSELMIFDIKDLEIEKIVLDEKEETTFNIGDNDDLMGSPLNVDIKKETKQVRIYFETSPEAEALQWLNPQQTAGKVYPYLFTQGQAILTRTWIPCQDTPGDQDYLIQQMYKYRFN